MFGPEMLQALQPCIAENIQRHERGDALRIGWYLEDPQAAIITGDRLHPFRTVTGEIVHLQKAVVRMTEAHDFLGQVPGVQCIPPLRGNQPQGAGQVRKTMPGTRHGCPVIHQETAGAVR